MRQHRHIGLERQDGEDVGRDPRTMTTEELARLGHARVSPLRALRLKRLDCCNGSSREVRLCTAVDCPSWPERELVRQLGEKLYGPMQREPDAPEP